MEILPKSQQLFIDEIDELDFFKDPSQLDQVLDDWRSRGVRIETVGKSLEGKEIKAAVFEPDPVLIGADPVKTVLAWGYPHPDEPLGAESLVVLGNAILDHGDELEISHIRFVFILCGDPDNASRQLWHGPAMRARTGQAQIPDAAEYFFGVWRPTHLGLEIDYGFPLMWGPFEQRIDYIGACHNLVECDQGCTFLKECKFKDEPYGPLPESLALAGAMERFKPNLVFSMHSNHTGGDYTFLFLKEDKKTLRSLQEVVANYSVRHLGEALDRGQRWFQSDPDLFRERDLNFRKRELERMDGYNENATYLGNASAVNWIEANLEDTQFICPEATLFSHPDFGNTNLVDDKIQARLLKTRSEEGDMVEKYYYNDTYFARRKLKPGSSSDLEFLDIGENHTGSTARPDNFDPKEMLLPRALLGVQAVYRRREIMDRIDHLWHSLNTQIDFDKYPEINHPFKDDRAAIRVPGKFIGDQAMLIFRSREDYLNPATIAQAATFNFFWSAQTAFVVGNFNNFLEYILTSGIEIESRDLYIIEQHQQKLVTLQESELYKLPEDMKKIKTKPAIQSILGRLFILINKL